MYLILKSKAKDPFQHAGGEAAAASPRRGTGWL